jgi:hypothetical protein
MQNFIILFFFILLHYINSQCGVISGPDKSGTIHKIDVTSLPPHKWKHDYYAEYELTLCEENIFCKGRLVPAAQHWQGQCIALGENSQTTMSLIGSVYIVMFTDMKRFE